MQGPVTGLYSPAFLMGELLFELGGKSLEGISQKVLTDFLRSMEADGLIIRTAYPEVPPRVEYSLSETGESLRPLLMTMQDWGENYKKQHAE